MTRARNLPPIGERVGVRLTLGSTLKQIREGVVERLNGHVPDSPVWVQFNARVGAWFESGQLVRLDAPAHCPWCHQRVPQRSDEDVRTLNADSVGLLEAFVNTKPLIGPKPPLTVEAIDQLLRDLWEDVRS